MVIVLERVPVSALQFSFVSGLCCAQLWLQFPSVVRRSLFFGLDVGILQMQYIIAMRCRVILVFKLRQRCCMSSNCASSLLVVVHKSVALLLCLSRLVCPGRFWLVDLFVCKAVSTSHSRGNRG